MAAASLTAAHVAASNGILNGHTCAPIDDGRSLLHCRPRANQAMACRRRWLSSERQSADLWRHQLPSWRKLRRPRKLPGWWKLASGGRTRRHGAALGPPSARQAHSPLSKLISSVLLMLEAVRRPKLLVRAKPAKQTRSSAMPCLHCACAAFPLRLLI